MAASRSWYSACMAVGGGGDGDGGEGGGGGGEAQGVPRAVPEVATLVVLSQAPGTGLHMPALSVRSRAVRPTMEAGQGAGMVEYSWLALCCVGGGGGRGRGVWEEGGRD